MSVLTGSHTHHAGPPPLRPAMSPLFDPVALGGLAALLGWIGSWIPSPWIDEGYTISAITRTFPQLIALVVTKLDAVHALYYIVAQLWVALFGVSVPAIRVISALALGAGAAGMVVLGRLLRSRRLGLTAGFVFMIIPQSMWMATQARSYALFAAVTVWMTVAFVSALATRTVRRWVIYGSLAVFGTYLNVFVSLVVLAHVLALPLSPLWRSRWRPALATASVTGIVTTPVVLLVARQQAPQMYWVPPVDRSTLGSIVLIQWFGGSRLFSAAAWLLIAAAITLCAISLVRRSRGSCHETLLATLWAAVPTVLIVGASVVWIPLYVPRYALISLGGVALVIALALERFLWPLAVVAVAVLAVLAVPVYLAQRQPASNGVNWTFAAQEASKLLRPGDALYVCEEVPFNGFRELNSGLFKRFKDPALIQREPANGELWDTVAPVVVAARRALGAPRVVMIGAASLPTATRKDIEAFQQAGFLLQRHVGEGGVEVYVLVAERIPSVQ